MVGWWSKEEVTSRSVKFRFLCSYLFTHIERATDNAVQPSALWTNSAQVEGRATQASRSAGPWYWLDGGSGSSRCEFATFALKQRWIRIHCANSSLLDSRIKRERSSQFISVMSQARRDPVNWILRGTDSRMTRAPNVQAFNWLHVLALSNFCLFNHLQDRPDLFWAVLGLFCIFGLIRVEFQAISSGHIAKRSKSTIKIKLDRPVAGRSVTVAFLSDIVSQTFLIHGSQPEVAISERTIDLVTVFGRHFIGRQGIKERLPSPIQILLESVREAESTVRFRRFLQLYVSKRYRSLEPIELSVFSSRLVNISSIRWKSEQLWTKPAHLDSRARASSHVCNQNKQSQGFLRTSS